MDNVGEEIDAIRRHWGKRLLILGHHYQRSSVLRHADETGDSLELSRKAATHPEAEKIVFCGVRFMAESADILTGEHQTVYMPAPSAGCPMANMATAAAMEAAWRQLGGADNGWLPVVYVNSSAEVKACCGRWGGSTCTSSNAARVFKWAFSQNKRVFFLPDEHLGRNTAHDMGIGDDEVVVYDPKQWGGGGAQWGKRQAKSEMGDADGAMARNIAGAKVVVWKGFCIVHVAFTAECVRDVRNRLPDAKIIVHPETPREVVDLTDAHGSTSQIIKYVESAPAGATIVVGTEQNLVARLAEQHKGRVTVKVLSPSICANMAKTSEESLLELLKEWPHTSEIHVPKDVVADARKALSKMLEL